MLAQKWVCRHETRRAGLDRQRPARILPSALDVGSGGALEPALVLRAAAWTRPSSTPSRSTSRPCVGRPRRCAPAADAARAGHGQQGLAARDDRGPAEHHPRREDGDRERRDPARRPPAHGPRPRGRHCARAVLPRRRGLRRPVRRPRRARRRARATDACVSARRTRRTAGTSTTTR
jgi:hypothetical protein